TVDVILAIQNGINIPKDSRFMIQAPLTGTPNLMIVPPVPHRLPPGYIATPLPPEAILPKEIQPIADQPVGTPVASISDLMQQGQGEVRRLDEMLSLLQQREPVLLDTLQTALANMDQLSSEFKGTVADLSSTMNGTMREAGGNIVSMTSTLNGTLSRNQYRIDSLLSSLDATAVALNKSMDQLQSLASDPRLKGNLLDTTSNIRDLTANIAGVTSDLRTISANPQTQAQLRDTVANLDATMQKADSLLGTLGGRSNVYGVDAGATPYPLPKGPNALPPPGTETPNPNGARSLSGGLARIASNLVAVQARVGYLSAQSVSGPSPLLTNDRGPQADLNAIFLPHGSISAMAGANDIGGKTTWNLVGLKNAGCVRAGGGILYSQIGILAACNSGKLGAETRIYDLRRPTFDVYGNLNVMQWAQLFLGERDTTRSDRRTVYGLQLNF
ncbi:MAG TPA: hypothetical protein VGZ02_13580, partial [Candidatus Baltobacteraceae bacterium]|nr:hypothetical protein [Candidatus Baltobacteraceae bacterium]